MDGWSVPLLQTCSGSVFATHLSSRTFHILFIIAESCWACRFLAMSPCGSSLAACRPLRLVKSTWWPREDFCDRRQRHCTQSWASQRIYIYNASTTVEEALVLGCVQPCMDVCEGVGERCTCAGTSVRTHSSVLAVTIPTFRFFFKKKGVPHPTPSPTSRKCNW